MKRMAVGSSLTLALALFTVCGTSACTTSEPPPRTSAEATILQASPSTSCPLGVQGARVKVDDTMDGVAMTFTAPPDRVDELRARAEDAAAMKGPGKGQGMGHDGKHGMGGDHGLKAMQLPPASAESRHIEGGARITFRPSFEGDLMSLRVKVRERAEAMMAGCNN